MAIYHIVNEKYNINFDLKFDTFYNFFESLKESTKYYYDYCKAENINIVEFDNEYIDHINILKSELLKYYILITNDNNVEKYIVINDIIKDLHNFMLQQIYKANLVSSYNIFPQFEIDDETYDTSQISRYYICNTKLKIYDDYNDDYNSESDDGFNEEKYDDEAIETTMVYEDANFIRSININYLTRTQLYRLIRIYTHNAYRYAHFQKGFLLKMGICNKIVSSSNKYLKYSCYKTVLNLNNSLNNYLDSLTIKSINERELDKILITLPNICISHISSKLLNNISDKPNLIDLSENLDDKYIAVD
jgi:hypothetical protein